MAAAVIAPPGPVRALGDPLRWRIVELLAGEQLCVAHLAEELGAAQPLVSHHLKVLREAGLVEADRYRYWTYYRLRPDALAALAGGLQGLARSAPTGMACRRAVDAQAAAEKYVALDARGGADQAVDAVLRLAFSAKHRRLSFSPASRCG